MELITGTGFFLGNCIHVSFTMNLHAVLYIICPFASLLCNSSDDTKEKNKSTHTISNVLVNFAVSCNCCLLKRFYVQSDFHCLLTLCLGQRNISVNIEEQNCIMTDSYPNSLRYTDNVCSRIKSLISLCFDYKADLFQSKSDS